MNRHRLDIMKLMFEKDGGYSLRKFKEIYLKEIKENPDKYFLDSSEDKSKKSYDELFGYGRKNDWKNSSLNYSNLVRRGDGEPETVRSKLIDKAINSGLMESKFGD